MDATCVEIFVDDEGGVEGIALVLRAPSIVEDENAELVAGCKLSAWDAKCLIHTLQECIGQIEA